MTTDAAPDFLQPGEPVDLTNCSREPIHTPGAVQPHGALLIARLADRSITQATENLQAVAGLSAAEVIGRALDDVVGRDAADRLIAAAARADGPRVRPDLVTVGGTDLDTSVFTPAPGLLGIDLEPADARVPAATDVIARVSSWAVRLQAQQSEDAAMLVAAQALRDLTGFDRTWAYRFEPDGHGVIVAEDQAGDLTSFLGLHFPESDIPAQARDLYLRTGVRVIADTLSEPSPVTPLDNPDTGAWTDLSGSGIRAVSPIHIRYLRNMGVRSSLSVPVVVGGRLWGLLSAHTYGEPRPVPVRVRAECEMLGVLASMQLTATAELSRARDGILLYEWASLLNDQLAAHDSLVDGLAADAGALLGLCRADGAIVAIGGERTTVGDVPAEADVDALLAVLARRSDDLVVSDGFPREEPTLGGLVDCASGVLAFPLSRSRGNWVIWLRRESIYEVTWGNRDQGLVRRDPSGVLELGHRESFERWAEEVRGHARPWRDTEIDAVTNLRASLGTLLISRADRLARLNEELERSNAELDAFAYAAAHDLREPVRGIEQFADFLSEDFGDVLGEEGREQIATILRLTSRMDSLLTALLEYAEIGESSWLRGRVHLPTMVDEVRELLAARIPVGMTFDVDDISVEADANGVRQLLLNLVWNAVKYSDDMPKVSVGAVWLRDAENGTTRVRRSLTGEHEPVAYFVRDEGIGIAPEFHDEVFQLFRRLHPRDAYGGGYGAGLTLARRIVERHGGAIWLESEPGAGTTVYFTLEPA